jgi:arylsulfatase A-like enzyme
MLLSVALAGGPPSAAHAASQPNILVIVTDDQRAHGTMHVMPSTRRIFGRQGTRFDNAFVTTPTCCPSRSSIFSGMYSHNHGVRNNYQGANFDPSKSWQRVLHDAGYRTGLFGKYLNGWDTTQTPPYFDAYADVDDDFALARDAQDFLLASESNDAQPWALEVATHSPHRPFDPKPRFRHAAVGPLPRNPAVLESDLSDKPPLVREQHGTRRLARRFRRGELRELMGTDVMVDRIFRNLRRTGEASNTLALFLSDNGFMWAEHHVVGKSLAYPPSVQVPLYLRWPRHVPEGETRDDIAANIDIAPTIYDATGLTPPYTVDGRSLLDKTHRRWLLLEGDRGSAPRFGSWIPWDALLSRDREYVRWHDGFIEDYDLDRDPWELSASNRRRARLQQLLREARSCVGASCP